MKCFRIRNCRVLIIRIWSIAPSWTFLYIDMGPSYNISPIQRLFEKVDFVLYGQILELKMSLRHGKIL